jgi:hypothetical protein
MFLSLLHVTFCHRIIIYSCGSSKGGCGGGGSSGILMLKMIANLCYSQVLLPPLSKSHYKRNAALRIAQYVTNFLHWETCCCAVYPIWFHC